MLACCVIGFFTYSQLQSNILSSKFQITDNDYKQNQTILKLTNKTDLMSTWKYYNVKNYQNGELLNDISGGNAFNNVYTQTTNGENDANFKSSLQSVIDQYDLPVSSDTLYMILKVNNKIIDGNTNTSHGPVFLSLLGDLFLYLSNVAVVTTFVNGRNWGLLPIIGFDTNDESFTYKNWVECLVNVNNDKVIYYKGQKWFGGDLTQYTIDWLKQYNKLKTQQEQIRDQQQNIFYNEFFDETGEYIAGSIYKYLNGSQKFFFVPELEKIDAVINEELNEEIYQNAEKESKEKTSMKGGDKSNIQKEEINIFNNSYKNTSDNSKIKDNKEGGKKFIYGFFPIKNTKENSNPIIKINIEGEKFRTKIKTIFN